MYVAPQRIQCSGGRGKGRGVDVGDGICRPVGFVEAEQAHLLLKGADPLVDLEEEPREHVRAVVRHAPPRVPIDVVEELLPGPRVPHQVVDAVPRCLRHGRVVLLRRDDACVVRALWNGDDGVSRG